MSTPATAVRRRRLLELMAVSASALTGCVRLAPVDPDAGRPTVAAAAAGSGTVSFTDSTGRQVELPREITRVAPASPLADIMLFPIAADEMVGWCSAPGRAAGEMLGTKYLELPELASAPQVIVDVGEWDEEYKAGLDSLQEDLGIPVILIDGVLGASGDALRLLGQALGKAELGEQLGAYADGVIGDVRARAAAIPQDRRLRVYYGEGADGLTTLGAGSVHAEVFEMAGAALVTDEGSVRAQGGEGMVSLEQVRGWNPDAIVLGPDSILSLIHISEPTRPY